MQARFGIRMWAFFPLLIAAIAAVWLAVDSRFHWDEPSYLYAGAYQSVSQIVAGEVQPSGIPSFFQGRILHVLFVKGVMAISASVEAGFRILVAIHLALMVFSLVLIWRILRALLPALAEYRAATLLVAMTPVALYMSCKTLGDNEALTAALIATYALIRGAHVGGAYWSVAAIVGLAVAALTKNQMVFLPAAFWATMCLVPIAGIDRRRLAVFGALSGIGAFLLTLATLEWLGVGLREYLASYGHPFENTSPLVAKFVNLGTELGLLWFLLPVALLSSRRRELLAFALWCVIAMAPFLYFSGVEPRHVAVNLVAVGGLFALALEVINERFDAWRRLSNARKSAVAVLGVMVLMGSNSIMLAIMPHRVDVGQLRAALRTLDEQYGAGRYSLLTARGYTDFHLIRVMWPKRDVRDVGTAAMVVRTDRRPREQALRAYLGDRYHESLTELARIDRPLVFIGYRHTFAAENLRMMLNSVSQRFGDRLLGKVTLVEHLFTAETQWLWGSPEVRLEPVAQIGHYVAFEVSIRSRDGAAKSVERAVKRSPL